MPANVRPLWRCPKCGAQFVTANMWHSCGKFSLEDLFAGSEPRVRSLFRKFTALVRRCGRVDLIPQKTRAVFTDRARFVAVYPRKNHFIAGIVTRRRIAHARVLKHEQIGRCHLRRVKVATMTNLDATLRGWVRKAYRDFGRQ